MPKTLIDVLNDTAQEVLTHLKAMLAADSPTLRVTESFHKRIKGAANSFSRTQHRLYIQPIPYDDWDTPFACFRTNSNSLFLSDPMFYFKPIHDLLGDLSPDHTFEPTFDSFENWPEFSRTEHLLVVKGPLLNDNQTGIPELMQTSERVYIEASQRIRAGALGTKFVIINPLSELWIAREQLRAMDRDERYRLPNEFIAKLPYAALSQYPYMAEKETNRGLIAFTSSPEHGAHDRQQVIKPGRYLKMHRPDLSDEEIKQIAATIDLDRSEYTLNSSREEGDFERIYTNGPSSCMSYSTEDKWGCSYRVNGNLYHPSRVYAHPENNIAIGWIEAKDGKILARALLNTQKMLHSRIYAREYPAGMTEQMRQALRVAGFHYSDDALEGEKIQRLSLDDNCDTILCPYIDPSNYGVTIYSDHLVIGGDNEADHSTGCLESYGPNRANYWTCSDCGEDIDEDEDSGNYVERNDTTVCDNCIQNYRWAARVHCDGTLGGREWIEEIDSDLFETGNMSPSAQRHCSHVYDPDYRLVRLSTDLYDEDSAITDRDVVEIADADGDTTDEYMCVDDMDQFDYVWVDGNAIHINDVVSLDDEYIPRNTLDFDEVRFAGCGILGVKRYETVEPAEENAA